MADMNTFVYFFAIVIVLAYCSIVLTDTMDNMTTTSNALTTDLEVQANNNMYNGIFQNSFLIILITIFIYLIKPSEDNKGVNYV